MVESSAAVIWKPPSPTIDPDLCLGPRELRADGGREREAHRPEAARRDELAGEVVVVILGLPHLVLAHVGDDERLALGDAPQVVDHVRGVEVARVSGRVWMSRTAESPLSSRDRSSQPPRRASRRPGAERAASRRTSPTSGTSTRTFLLISAGSISTWIFFARWRVRRRACR